MDDRLLELVVPPDRAEVRTARRFVGDNLQGLVADDVIADLELITSELVTNAVEHGANQAIEIAVRCADDEISITVVSAGPSPGVGPVRGWELAAIDDVTGRGLGIVRLVADHVEIDRSPERLALTACRRVGGRRSRLAES